MKNYFLLMVSILTALSCMAQQKTADLKKAGIPNIIIIYTDDLGFGDISANGAITIQTPHIDQIASSGIRFTNAYATAATCTPSRFSLLTGKYAWRKQGTGIAPGNAALIIPIDALTLPKMLQKAGYQTAVVGKWHLGLGAPGNLDWNKKVIPGPYEIGFDYSFIMPATGDRVPCVYMENQEVVDLEPADPVFVDYKNKIGNDPTGSENPELLKMKFSHGHNNTIINGVSRIGWMTGGKKARWIDEDMADVFTSKALQFIEQNKEQPFFLYFATHDIHVPRLPHSRFAGKSKMGPRGDAILQLDWAVGEVTQKLKELGLDKNTLLIFTSDNGPVVDDGYEDKAVELLGPHSPSGPFRGGKYSAFEAGTRIPFLLQWPGTVKAGIRSDKQFSQVDLFASFAALLGVKLDSTDAPDSFNMLAILTGKPGKEREYIIQQSLNNRLSVVKDGWKYISPGNGPKINKNTQTELGNDSKPQLYNLKKDTGEKENLADRFPAKAEALSKLTEFVRSNSNTRR